MSKEALSKSWLTKKEVIDSLYDGFMITLGTLTIGFAGKKIFGIAKPCSKLDFEDVAKLTGYITASVISIDYAKYREWIPPSIAPKT